MENETLINPDSITKICDCGLRQNTSLPEKRYRFATYQPHLKKMVEKIDFKGIAVKNMDGIAAFALKLVYHDGKINKEYVYEVLKDKGGLSLKHPKEIRGEYINGGIRIPGEITNSFCTMYEIGYFVNAILLSAVVSTLPIKEYKKQKNKTLLLKKIRKDIESLSSETIEESIKSPKIPIISWLTDDVEAFRFRKEMLWGVNKEVSKKVIGEIAKKDLGKEQSEEFHNILWVDKDKEITDKAIKYSKNMCEAKMIQYYLAIEEFLKLMGIELNKVPFYFFCSPCHELMELGPNHEFLDFLIEMHSPESLKVFSQITSQENPVLIKIPCPNCGESSKKVLNGRIKGKDRKTIRLVCSKEEKTFNNEHGIGTKVITGCGHVWEFEIPKTSKELYNLLKEKSFSLHVALTNSLQVFKTTAISPVAHVICDLNIYYDDNGEIKIFAPYPRGFGSSAELFTSVMAFQLAFLNGKVAKPFYEKAKKRNSIVDSPFMIIAHQSPSKLFSDKDIYKNILKDFNIKVGPQDSSIWKVLEQGMTPEEIFKRSIDLTYYPAEKMVKDIRKLDINSLGSVK